MFKSSVKYTGFPDKNSVNRIIHLVKSYKGLPCYY